MDGTGRLTLRNRRFLRKVVKHSLHEPNKNYTFSTPQEPEPVTNAQSQGTVQSPLQNNSTAPTLSPWKTPAYAPNNSQSSSTTTAQRKQSATPAQIQPDISTTPSSVRSPTGNIPRRLSYGQVYEPHEAPPPTEPTTTSPETVPHQHNETNTLKGLPLATRRLQNCNNPGKLETMIFESRRKRS